MGARHGNTSLVVVGCHLDISSLFTVWLVSLLMAELSDGRASLVTVILNTFHDTYGSSLYLIVSCPWVMIS